MTKRIQLTIQEIVNDFYSLAQEEGYISGLGNCEAITEQKEIEYHCHMRDLIDKYIPDWYDKINKLEYKNEDDVGKGFLLSTMLTDNFKQIFYKLI